MHWFLKPDYSKQAITFTYEDDDGYERKHVFRARPIVCQRCQGTGVHDHPAFSNGITSDEWAQWDHEEREDYRRGMYDVPCSECRGNKIDLEIDRNVADPDMLAIVDDWIRSEAEDRAAAAAERRMGA